MKIKLIFIIIINFIIVASCNNINPSGGKCHYDSFEKKYEVKNIIKEKDSIISVKFKAVSSTDSDLSEIELKINRIKELKKGISISAIKKGDFYILKGDKITKGSCIPYQILEISNCKEQN